jgi:hypothetical protein
VEVDIGKVAVHEVDVRNVGAAEGASDEGRVGDGDAFPFGVCEQAALGDQVPNTQPSELSVIPIDP